MRRDAVLRGTRSAARAHRLLKLTEGTVPNRSIDVFGAIRELDVPLRFTELNGLLGACLKVSDYFSGILVTTERDLHLQRFTAAHELGHFVMEHGDSMDREVAQFGSAISRPTPEVEADAFAAEFLMPKWLLRATCKQRGWWSKSVLTQPRYLYQLSLRLATSYHSTCLTMGGHNAISESAASSAATVKPKAIKQNELNGVKLDNPWADVWLVSMSDHGCVLEAGPDDLFVLDLEERSAAGYLWDLDSAINSGFVVVHESVQPNATLIGSPSKHRYILRASQGTRELSVSHKRPFAKDNAALSILQVSVSTTGAQKAGDYSESVTSDG